MPMHREVQVCEAAMPGPPMSDDEKQNLTVVVSEAENVSFARSFDCVLTQSEILTTHWRIQGRAVWPCAPPPAFQSYAVANTATLLFEATCEHDKNIQRTRNIFKRKFCT